MRRKAGMLWLVMLCVFLVVPNALYVGAASDFSEVYIGGYPIVVDLENDGVIIVGAKTNSENFPYKLNEKADIKKGDIIKEIAGILVSTMSDIDVIMSKFKNGNAVNVKLLRGDKMITTSIYPIKEECSGKYKLGFWLKDKISGLGTVTFVGKNSVYASLGHSIMDEETGVKFTCKSGSIYECKLMGIVKGNAGTPGRLKGRCINCMYPKGNIKHIDDTGMYGKYTETFPRNELYKIGGQNEVKMGAAKIYTTIGDSAKYYDIEIVKAVKQVSSAEKSMVVKITDAGLIAQTGGIVQGMSGSPIVQNGKIVGAITHVFTNNPIMGYGIYADWMTEKAAAV